MEKPKMSLTEELKKIDHINGYDKDFTLDESRRYAQKTKNSIYNLKIVSEKNNKSANKKILTEAELLTEWAFLAPIVGALGRTALGRGLASVGTWSARAGSRGLLSKAPNWAKSLFGFGKVSTRGLKTVTGKNLAKSTVGKIATGKNLGGMSSSVAGLTNANMAKGLGSLLTWGTGAYLIGSGNDGTPLPGDAVGGQQDWSEGQEVSKEDWLSMCFSPAYYDSLVQMDNDDSDISVTFQSEGDIAQIATAIHDATEGGEKYFGKSIVDFVSFGATEGAGTDEESVYRAFQAINTVGDCSHLSKIYQLKYDVPLLEELFDEMDESDLNQVYNTLKGKPLTIIDGKKIFTNKDLEKMLEEKAEEVYQRPEGLPAYRITFKTLFDGKSVDLFVATEGGSAVTAIVFVAGTKDYLGQFQYIENSDEKYYFQTPQGQNYGITDEEDKAKLAKVFGKANDEEDAAKDILTLTKSIEVGGTIYEVGESLEDISGNEGSADEYIDELVEDNPRTATAKPTALQGAAIALAMGVEDFEVLTESIKGLGKVLGESKLVVEQKYSVKFNRDDNSYKIRRVRKTVKDDTKKPSPDTTNGSSSNVAPTLTSVAAGNGIIKKGMRGDSVSAIQRTLGVTITGIFDSKTEQAVKTYQKTKGLKVDGIVGPETAKMMTGTVDDRPSDEVKSDEKKIKNISGRFATDDEAETVIKKMETVQDDQVSREDCISLIGAAFRALPTLGGPETYKVLQFCYAKYNFGVGKSTRRVKRKYGIKGDGDLKNKRRR